MKIIWENHDFLQKLNKNASMQFSIKTDMLLSFSYHISCSESVSELPKTLLHKVVIKIFKLKLQVIT